MQYLIRRASAIYSHGTSATDIRIKDGLISEIGKGLQQESTEEVQLDAQHCVIYPGFVNTHHHLAQSVLKAIPEGINQGLGEWLASVPYRYWPHIKPDLMYSAAKLGMYELLRSGTSTCADHHYLYHANCSPEVEEAVWQAAEDMGIRMVLCRGGATVMGSHKGMAEAGIKPESIEQNLARLETTYIKHHHTHANPMKQLVVAPTSLIHSSMPEHLKQLAQFARSHQLKMHSHLLEVEFDEIQAREKYGMSAIEYAHSVNWLGEDVFFAHLVQANGDDIRMLAETNTGISHCPTSNCRLGSGIARVTEMEQAGMPISIGVDGSASSENASMLQELNMAWLIHRTQHGPASTKVNNTIKWGSQGGANILGLTGIGELKVGMAADLTAFDISSLRYAGMHSPLEAPLMAGEPATVKYGFVNGKLRVADGMVNDLDVKKLRRDVLQGLMELNDCIV